MALEAVMIPELRTIPFKLVPRKQGRRKLEDNEIEGHASVFGVVDSFNTRIVKGAFRKSIKEKFDIGKIKFLFNHFTSQMPGKLTDLREDKEGLFFRAVFSDTALGRDTITLVRDEALTDLSIGFNIVKFGDFDEDEGVQDIREVNLWEISIVTFGSNAEAMIEDFRTGGDPEQNVTAQLYDELRASRAQFMMQGIQLEALQESVLELQVTQHDEETSTEETSEDSEDSEEETKDDTNTVDDTNRSSENEEENQEEMPSLDDARAIARARQGEALTSGAATLS